MHGIVGDLPHRSSFMDVLRSAGTIVLRHYVQEGLAKKRQHIAAGRPRKIQNPPHLPQVG